MEKIRLGDVADVITKGTTPTSIGYEFVNKGINFIKVESINEDGAFIENKFAYITDECDKKLSRSQLQENDILFSIAGAIGRVAIVDKNILPANTNQALAIIRLHKGVYEYNFLKYILKSPAISKQFEKQKKGVAQINLSLKNIGDFEIPVISIEQQKKISLELDNITALINKRKKQLEKLDELVKSRFIELFGDPQRNPHGYKHTKLSDIATYYNGLTYKPENVAAEGTIVLRSGNIQNSQLDFADTVRVDCAIKERLMVQKNDILMCSRNGSAKLVGKVALIKDIQEPMSFGAFMMIIRSHYFGYLMTYFQMDAFRQQIKTGATTTINQITGRMLDDVTIPLPPMSLVDQFAAFVKQIDKSKFEIKQSLEKLELLKKALMQKYFG
mgnify:FL=1